MGNIYCIYKDDGPRGVSGQTVDATRHRCELHRFGSYERYTAWCEMIGAISTRKNWRVEGVWSDDENNGFPCILNHPTISND